MLRARQLPLVALTCAALAGCHALAGYQSTDGAALPDALADAPARPVDLPGQLVDIAPVDMPRDAVDDTVARDASARDAAARDGKLSTTDTTLQMSDGATIGVDKGLVTPCTKDADCMPLRCCNARSRSVHFRGPEPPITRSAKGIGCSPVSMMR